VDTVQADTGQARCRFETLRGLRLFRYATQTVFGEGPSNALVVMVGEQPGDREDLSGKPFVGPAGKLLDRALADAGVDRRQVYVTNAVKALQICGARQTPHPWKAQRYRGLGLPPLARSGVASDSTAPSDLPGSNGRTVPDGSRFPHPARQRHSVPHRWAQAFMATIHPSALLRMPEPERRDEEYRLFVQDLALIPKHLSAPIPEQRS